jgi:PAS domain S-box-containing protein
LDVTERVRAEKQREQHLADLQMVTARLQATFQAIADGVVVYGVDGEILRMNGTAESLLGYSQTERRLPAEERTALLRVRAADGQSFASVQDMPYVRALHGETVRNVTMALRNLQTNQRFWISASAAPVRAPDASLLGAVASFTDITELRRAQDELELRVQERTAELAEANEALRYQADLLANVSDAVVATDEHFIMTAWNRAAEELYGWKAEEVLGRRGAELIPSEYVGTDRDAVFRSLRETGRWRGVVRQQRRDGTTLICEVTSMVLKDKAGRVSGYVSVNRDVTERMRTEETLRESEQRFRHTFEHAAIGMALIGTDGRFLQVNPSLCRMFGYTASELPEKTFQELTHPDDIDVGVELFRDLLAGKQEYGWLEKRYVHREGHAIWALLSTSVVRDVLGAPLYLVSQIQDMTERKDAEKALRQSESRFRSLFEYSPLGIALSRDGVILAANRAYVRMFGHDDVSELVGTSLLNQIAPQHRHQITERVEMRERGEHVPDAYETLGQRKDGSLFPFHIRTARIRLPDGEASVGFFTDITEQVRAEELLHARERRQTALLEFSQRALAETDRSVLMDEAVSSVARTMEVDYCGVLELLPDDNALLLRAGVGWRAGLVGRALVDAGRASQAGFTLVSSEPVIVQDLRTETRFKVPPLLMEHGVVSSISVIIRGQELPYGILGVHTARQRHFTLGDVHFLQTVANVLSTVIERTWAHETLERHIRRLELLHKIDRAIVTAQSPREIAGGALQHIRQLLAPCDGANLTLFDLETHQGTVLATDPGRPTEFGVGTRMPLELAGDLEDLRQGKVYVVDDVQTVSEPSPMLRALQASGLRSYMCVPLAVRDELLGSINLRSDQPGAFAPEHADVTRELADPLAIAIQQAQLLDQLSAARERQKMLTRRLVEAQEDERRRVARELHDEIGQTLTAVKINLQTLGRQADWAGLAPRLADSIAIVERALQQVRNLSLDLRPSLLDDLGLVATLRWYVDRQAQWAGLTISFSADPPEMSLPPEHEITCFRVVQEAFTNLMRHAQAKHVRVALRQRNGELGLTIRDDGVGFGVQAALDNALGGESLGLLGMQERVRLVGGEIDIESEPGQGTEIRVRLPLTF